uniref:Man1/Src1 C-terminal domain-containing protein n=1 Tax=Odontella aurita TaxID=265563 RepID=A0A7S4JYY5_9STRA|mmetsp:Transcript_57581/g.171715  ORF Transcript_57581/g.171715 Transcript_57581/m.171715 type:complete len:630 (+) Transcript_57581:1-1890(+)
MAKLEAAREDMAKLEAAREDMAKLEAARREEEERKVRREEEKRRARRRREEDAAIAAREREAEELRRIRREETEAGLRAIAEPFREEALEVEAAAAVLRGEEDARDALYGADHDDDQVEMEKDEGGVVGSLAGKVASAFRRMAKYGVLLAALFLSLLVTYGFFLREAGDLGLPRIDGPESATDKEASGAAVANMPETPCFVDNPLLTIEQRGALHRLDESERAEILGIAKKPPLPMIKAGVDTCTNPAKPVPCPERGLCSGGYLRECAEPPTSAVEGLELFEVSESFDACVPAGDARHVMEEVKGALVDLAMERTCGPSCRLTGGYVCSIARDAVMETTDENGGRGWMYKVGSFVEYVNSRANDGEVSPSKETVQTSDEDGEGSVSRTMITADVVRALAPHMDADTVKFVDVGDGGTNSDLEKRGLEAQIGLTPSYIRASLPLPLPCWTLLLLFKLARFLCAPLMRLALAHPVYSALFLLAAVILRKRRRRAARLALVKLLVADVRERAYDLLAECDDGEGYAALHLRDQILHDVTLDPPPELTKQASARVQRKFLADAVWPCVVAEVRRDNRIRKSTREVPGGKRLEWWEWISRAGKKSRRSRGGMMSPGGIMMSPEGIAGGSAKKNN